MKLIIILLGIIISVLILGIRIYIWSLTDSIKSGITDKGIKIETKKYKHPNAIIIGVFLGFWVPIVITSIWLPNMLFGDQILLGVIGSFIGMLIAWLISRLKG